MAGARFSGIDSSEGSKADYLSRPIQKQDLSMISYDKWRIFYPLLARWLHER